MDSYLNDIKNWKKTGKKVYEIWMCMPPLGTKVHNHLENVDYVVDEKKRFVLSGTEGEQWVIDGNKLAKTYTFATGEPITPEAVRRKGSAGVLEWTKVKTIPGAMENFACLLPKSKYTNFPVKTAWGSLLYANAPGVKHGDGDYLVCSMTPDGQPNLNDVWVVNGRIFPATYNLQNIQVSEKAKSAANANPEMPKSICQDGIKKSGNEFGKAVTYWLEHSFMRIADCAVKNNIAGIVGNTKVINVECNEISVAEIKKKLQSASVSNVDKCIYDNAIYNELYNVDESSVLMVAKAKVAFKYSLGGFGGIKHSVVIIKGLKAAPKDAASMKCISFGAIKAFDADKDFIIKKCEEHNWTDFNGSYLMNVEKAPINLLCKCLSEVTAVSVGVGDIALIDACNTKVMAKKSNMPAIKVELINTVDAPKGKSYIDTDTVSKLIRNDWEKDSDGTRHIERVFGTKIATKTTIEGSSEATYADFIAWIAADSDIDSTYIGVGNHQINDLRSIRKYAIIISAYDVLEFMLTEHKYGEAKEVISMKASGNWLAVGLILSGTYKYAGSIKSEVEKASEHEEQIYAACCNSLSELAERLSNLAFVKGRSDKQNSESTWAQQLIADGKTEDVYSYALVKSKNEFKQALVGIMGFANSFSANNMGRLERSMPFLLTYAAIVNKLPSIIKAVNLHGLKVVRTESRDDWFRLYIESYCSTYFTCSCTFSSNVCTGRVVNSKLQEMKEFSKLVNGSEVKESFSKIIKAIPSDYDTARYDIEYIRKTCVKLLDNPAGEAIKAELDKFMGSVVHNESDFLCDLKVEKNELLNKIVNVLGYASIISEERDNSNGGVDLITTNRLNDASSKKHLIKLNFEGETLVEKMNVSGEIKEYRFALDMESKAKVIPYKILTNISRALGIDPVNRILMSESFWHSVSSKMSNSGSEFNFERPVKHEDGNISVKCDYTYGNADGDICRDTFNIVCTTDVAAVSKLAPVKFRDTEADTYYTGLLEQLESEESGQLKFGFDIDGNEIKLRNWKSSYVQLDSFAWVLMSYIKEYINKDETSNA